ncbi:MAG: maleylpyruvate isomerase family mycothiol-dependent enzyme [Mycobacteriales bacterium]
MIELIARERLELVELLRGLAPEDWQRPSLCAGWTVHHVLAHLCTPFAVSKPRMMATFATAGGIGRAIDQTARRLAEREPAELLAVLAANARSTFRPPGLPHAAPLTDAVAHGADIRWALSPARDDWGDPARLRPVLDFLTGVRARAGFVPPGRLRGLALVADDLDWSTGDGDEVRGPALGLIMAVLGRPAAHPLLTGAGVPVLAAR